MTTTKKPKKTTRASTPIEDLPPNPFVFEVLNVVNKQRSTAKKVEALKKFEHDSLKALFIWNFDESVISVLPEGEVPYTGYDEQTSYSGTLTTKISEDIRRMHETGSFSMGATDKQGRTTIRREYVNFYHFLKGGNNSLSGLRRETMFINILEGLHPLEAEILILVKDKRLNDKDKITQEIVSLAYPQITGGGRS